MLEVNSALIPFILSLMDALMAFFRPQARFLPIVFFRYKIGRGLFESYQH